MQLNLSKADELQKSKDIMKRTLLMEISEDELIDFLKPKDKLSFQIEEVKELIDQEDEDIHFDVHAMSSTVDDRKLSQKVKFNYNKTMSTVENSKRGINSSPKATRTLKINANDLISEYKSNDKLNKTSNSITRNVTQNYQEKENFKDP